jgi:hypothetical protein
MADSVVRGKRRRGEEANAEVQQFLQAYQQGRI